MNRAVVCLLIFVTISSLKCDDGLVYIKIRKQSEFAANQEKFKIISGTEVIYENPDMVDYQLRTIEECISPSVHNQYTLELSDSGNSSWTSGSWIEIRGLLGNIVFKTYMVDNSLEVYDLSLYYAVEEGSSVKFSSSYSAQWMTLSFADNDWTQLYLPNLSLQVSGTQYFRKVFEGVGGLAAYELRLSYRYGIVAYINGNEVFRDNMNNGPVTHDTVAIGSYSTIDYHGVIRNGIEISTGNQIVAVELHPIHMEQQETMNFNMWLAQYASSYVKANTANCYAIPYTPTITTTSGNNEEYATDYNKSSYWSIASFESSESITYQYTDVVFNMNGVSLFPSVNPSYSPSDFTLQAAEATTFESLFSVDQLVYTSMEYHIETSPFITAIFERMRLLVEAVPDEKLWIYELNPLVCSLSLPTTITMTPAASIAMVNIEMIDIQPTIRGFTNCTVAPSLPAGLSLDTNTCRITGRAEQTLVSTVFTITARGGAYTGTFTIEIDDCEGGIIEFTRTYKSNAQKEGFVIKDKHTGVVVFSEEVETTQVSSTDVTRRLCLPSSEYSVILSCTSDYWSSNSFLYIDAISNTLKERLLRVRFDNKIGLSTSIDFNVHYAIPAAGSWFYKPSTVPDNWYSTSMDSWTEYGMGQYPQSTNRIQLYKKAFTISSLSSITGIALSLRYRYGCIVYINQHEAFRVGFSGSLTPTSSSTHIYETLQYRFISLPVKVMTSNGLISLLNEGSNVIAVGLLAVSDSQKESEFDAALRLLTQPESNRVFDYSVTGSGITGNVGNVFLDYYSNNIYYRTCTDNVVELQFDDDRRETITSFSINTYYLNMNYLPGGVTLKAKNPEDSEFTLLGSFSGWKWWQNPQLKKILLANTKPYNIYRFENFNTGDATDCYWKLNRLAFYLDAVNTTDSLSYPSMDAYRGIELAEIFPSSSAFLSFSIQPTLPTGLFMDPNTGVILGKPDSITETPLFTVTALSLTGMNVTTTFHLNVTECTGGKSLITVNIRTDTAPAQISTRLYQGKGTSGEVMYEEDSFPSNTMVYQDYCLPHAIYTYQALDSNGNGWYFPAGFHMTVDRGTLPFFVTHVPQDQAPVSVTHVFSSYLPFQVDFDGWKILKDTPPTDWASSSFNDSTWTVVKATAIGKSDTTVYIRKSFSIPSLTEYHVLNVHCRYNGGIVAYFNGRLVARFNLPDNFDHNTEAPTAHQSSAYSRFHVILASSGAIAGTNVIAFESHRVKDMSSSVDVVFDATGVFGIEDCSVVVDSYLTITGTDPSTNNLEDAFDMNPSTFMNLPKTEGNQIQWTVENLEGSRFNSMGIYFGLTMNNLGWTLSGTFQNAEEESEMIKQSSISPVNRELNAVRVPVGLAGFKRYHWVMNTASTVVPRISEFVFQYCKPAGEGICPGVDDYPSVAEGEISPSICPAMYEGYAYRLCSDGKLGEIQTTHCTPKLPANLHYTESRYEFVMNTSVSTGVPTYINLIESFFMDTGITLPPGLVLNEKTGEISGIPQNITDLITYTIYGANEKGAVLTEVSISVRKGVCREEGAFKTTPVGETFVYECSQQGSYMGTQSRKCILGSKDGEWEKVSGRCISIVTLVIVIVVVILVIVIVVMIIVRISKKKKAVAGVRGKKVDVSSVSKNKTTNV